MVDANSQAQKETQPLHKILEKYKFIMVVSGLG